ncbi:MAG: ABC transporter substrate-binding protein [Chloroflexota bacterium]|nr:ABC transporter substrate-binding protein [Chloroflexota bacterium]
MPQHAFPRQSSKLTHWRPHRRFVVGGAAAALFSGRLVSGGRADAAQAGTPPALADGLTIDLAVEPPTLDPALAYEIDAWSVVHSIYDSLLQFGANGEMEPLLAESFSLLDPLTYEIDLRQGIAFHNGEPFDARSVSFTLAHILNPETGSQVAQNFSVIENVEEVDDHTVRFHLAAPAPWLPSQIAPWMAMLPPEYAADSANDFASNPVGTGPFRFIDWERGQRINLERNPDYFADSAKGHAIAQSASFRFVGEASTRVADLLSGSVDLIRDVPADQIAMIEQAGSEVVAFPISGSAWVRVPTDVEPFSDARVRQALNHAVDIEGIVEALLAGHGERLASLFVPGGLGYDPDLAPFPYDPERARQLLAEAGYPDGFATTIDYASTEAADLVTAIAGQLSEVGIRTDARPVELATFNATWTDQAAAPLRFLTWRPLFDPYTLLSLVVSSGGFLSRYSNDTARELIEQGAVETDPEARAGIYRELGRALYDEPAAIYGFDLVAFYGVGSETPPWTPRADDYILPTYRREDGAE